MNELEFVMNAYQKARSIDESNEAEKINAIFALEKNLLSSNSDDMKELNYTYLKDISDWRVYLICRAALIKRADIETFLLAKMPTEQDQHIVADIIHILGRIRSPFAYDLALKNIHNENEEIRTVSLYVIGWTGNVKSIEQLKQHLLYEVKPILRITAGSAIRQIFWRTPEVKDVAIAALKEAFYHEKDDEVLGRIIELLTTITTKNLGMREDKSDPNKLTGDLAKAILKTKKYFDQ